VQTVLEVHENATLQLQQGLSNQRAALVSQKRVLIVICAHNEIASLPYLLRQLGQNEVLVVDDGSTDGTGPAAEVAGAQVLRHAQRLGKSASLAHAIAFALANDYDTIVEIGADAIPTEGAVEYLLRLLEPGDVGGVSLVQIPVGPPNMAYYVDELIWSVLANGKRLQMAKYHNSHIGGVMFAFKPGCVSSVDGSVNDDERVGECIRMRGFLTIFGDASQVYFDASSSAAHILQRRRRMYFGHMMSKKSTAPSMDVAVAACAFFKSLMAKPSRLAWAIPAVALEVIARLAAWRDTRRPAAKEEYTRWVTTYAKNNSLLIRNIVNR
jgi:glycosyltransferase involved in cell wall biosynthesis